MRRILKNMPVTTVTSRFSAHQKKHARLHDFPGQFHQSPLFKKHLRNTNSLRKTISSWSKSRFGGLLDPGSPCRVERSHGDHWGRTESASASGSYPESRKERWAKKCGQRRLTAWLWMKPHPLFHDVVSMVGYFLHDTESSWMHRRKQVI